MICVVKHVQNWIFLFFSLFNRTAYVVLVDAKISTDYGYIRTKFAKLTEIFIARPITFDIITANNVRVAPWKFGRIHKN